MMAYETNQLWRDVGEEEGPEPKVAAEDVRGPVVPWMLNPLQNLYRSGGPAYLWLRLLPNGDDLTLEECEQDSVGHRPGWLDDGITETGIEGIIQHRNWKPDTGSWFYWALTNGIGPGQPFCVELYPPRWSGGGYWDNDEWDCYWDWNVVRVMPRKDAGRSWDEYLKKEQRLNERFGRTRAQAIKELTHKRERDRGALYLTWGTMTDGYSPHNFGGKPHAVKVELCSKHVRHSLGYQLPAAMAFGLDEQGTNEGAFADLLRRMAETEIGKPRTTWDLLRNPFKPYISEKLLRSLLPQWSKARVKCTHCKDTGFLDARAIDCPHCDAGA